jgi:hypothetical protein
MNGEAGLGGQDMRRILATLLFAAPVLGCAHTHQDAFQVRLCETVNLLRQAEQVTDLDGRPLRSGFIATPEVARMCNLPPVQKIPTCCDRRGTGATCLCDNPAQCAILELACDIGFAGVSQVGDKTFTGMGAQCDTFLVGEVLDFDFHCGQPSPGF